MCSTAKKVTGAAPGYAICVVNLKSIQYFPLEDLYYWNIELADVIKPIHMKGQLKLFNVDDDLIKPISRKEFEKEVQPLIYTPKRRKKSNKIESQQVQIPHTPQNNRGKK